VINAAGKRMEFISRSLVRRFRIQKDGVIGVDGIAADVGISDGTG
jgi:hypothetical protein